MSRGRFVDRHYLPADVTHTWKGQRFKAPYFTVSQARCDEIQTTAPDPFHKSKFRIVRDYGSTVDLQWVL